MSTNGAKAATASSASLTAHERQVLYEIYADDTAIARARAAADQVAAQVAAIDRAPRARAARAQRSRGTRCTRPSTRLATRLAAWYRQGSPPDAVEIFLGARSLSSAIDEVQLWHRATHMDRSVITQTTTARARYSAATRSLASARASGRASTTTRCVAGSASLEQARGARAALLDSLRRQARAAERRRIADARAPRDASGERARSAAIAPAARAGDPTPVVQLAPRRSTSAPVHSGRLARRVVDRLRAARAHRDRAAGRPGRVRGRPLGDPARHALRRAGLRQLRSRPTPARRSSATASTSGCRARRRRRPGAAATSPSRSSDARLRRPRPVPCQRVRQASARARPRASWRWLRPRRARRASRSPLADPEHPAVARARRSAAPA